MDDEKKPIPNIPSEEIPDPAETLAVPVETLVFNETPETAAEPVIPDVPSDALNSVQADVPEDLKKRTRYYKKMARKEAKAFLKEKRSCDSKEDKKAFKSKWRMRKKDWKSSYRHLDEDEKKAQKAGFKAFKKRRKRPKRMLSWGIVLSILLVLLLVFYPVISMLFGVMGSQKYTNSGEAVNYVREKGSVLSAEICDEGFVLLKNDDSLLPLTDKKVNVFGDDAYNFVYGGSGSAGADQADAVSLFSALEMNGFEYNKDLDSAYNLNASGRKGSIVESVKAFFGMGDDSGDWTLLSEDVIEQARHFSNQAIIVLSSMEVEGAEIDMALLQPAKEGTNKAAMIDAVCSSFDNVIIIVNSGNVMELGFIRDYPSVKSVLWVGSPGSVGTIEIARVLNGEVNPSGRTVDTWPVSIEAEPSYATYGDNLYTNAKLHLFDYCEGIYVGYRYYETRFGLNASQYKANVVFPFGHGLSYTSFSKEITDFTHDRENITLQVKVTNTGSVSGKDVVEVYFSAPYYEKSNLEKSAIELAGFAKTSLLSPGSSETVTVSFPVRDMSSYSVDKGCYLLEKGDYAITVGDNVHDALLSDDIQTYTVNLDTKYTTDDATGVKIQNLFGFADGGLTYLSRSDWDGTYPSVPSKYTASAEVLADKKAYEESRLEAEMPVTGADNGLVLADLKGRDFNDPQWDLFLDQFNVDEMISLCANGGWHTVAVDRLGVPATHLLDGPSGINSMYSKLDAVAYPMETVVSSSWNTEMAAKLGEVIAAEAEAYGVDGWYAPAMNIHRNSIGGRNNEYYSEDPLLSGKMAASTINAAQEKGLIVFMKHFVCNDVELNARSDVSVWVSEQALREIYLRPFEYAVKEGHASGAMSSFSRLGVKWCGGSSELLQDLLRDEWGFEGVVSTDAALGSWMNAVKATQNGNDLMLEMGLQTSQSKLEKAYASNPAGTAAGLRNSVHDICYVIANYVI